MITDCLQFTAESAVVGEAQCAKGISWSRCMTLVHMQHLGLSNMKCCNECIVWYIWYMVWCGVASYGMGKEEQRAGVCACLNREGFGYVAPLQLLEQR